MDEFFGIDVKRIIDETAFILPYCKKSHVHSDPLWDNEFICFDSHKDDNAPLMSIAILAYNSERTIGKCIEGILSQDLTCSLEIVISDDCATDNTRSVCELYRDKYPDIIRILDSPCNVGSAQNLMRALSACRGEYIACVDGDDFYCHPKKLQIQVDYLIQHPDVSMVFGGVDVQLDDYRFTRVHYSSRSRALRRNLNDCQMEEWRRRYVFYDPVCTITPLFRRSALKQMIIGTQKLFDICKWLPVQDQAAWFFAAQVGRVHYLDEILGVYRLSASSHTAIIDVKRMLLNILGCQRIRLGLILLEPDLFKAQDVHNVVIQTISLTYEFLSTCDDELGNITYLRELADVFKDDLGAKFYAAIVCGDKTPFISRAYRRLIETKKNRRIDRFLLKKIAINFLGL